MTAVRHGIRVSFNMSVKWTVRRDASRTPPASTAHASSSSSPRSSLPLQSPPLAGEHEISPLEDTLVSPIEHGHVRRLWRREAAAEAYPVGV